MKKDRTNPSGSVPVLGFDEADEWRDRGVGAKLVEHLPLGELASEVKNFVDSLEHILESTVPKTVKGFELEKVEVTAGLTIKGKIGIVAFGAEATGLSSLKFVLTRSQKDPEDVVK